MTEVARSFARSMVPLHTTQSAELTADVRLISCYIKYPTADTLGGASARGTLVGLRRASTYLHTLRSRGVELAYRADIPAQIRVGVHQALLRTPPDYCPSVATPPLARCSPLPGRRASHASPSRVGVFELGYFSSICGCCALHRASNARGSDVGGNERSNNKRKGSLDCRLMLL